MHSAQLNNTVAMTKCRSCAGPIKVNDNFCRRCGTNQSTFGLGSQGSSQWGRDAASEEMKTTPLITGSLAKKLTQTVALRTAPFVSSRLGTCVVTALITVPVWLMIILLSPLEAFATARTVSSNARN
ncbi:MAG TPA: hypothetical protein VFV34_05080 [Blastocatellia bacterium]|nr:hypothetical protein [Blastocatellia bacterium]